MSIFRSGIARSGFAFSVALTASAVAAADTTKVIFSAENALYGAGYQIGRADGWMDDTLRQAVRSYQKQNNRLTVSGDLDPETLTALGIASKAGVTISGNDVATKADALAALGMSEPSRPSPSPKKQNEPKKLVAKTFAVPPAPKPEAQPEPVVVAPVKPAPAATPEPEVAVNEKPYKAEPAPAKPPEKSVAKSPAPVADANPEVPKEKPVMAANAPSETPADPQPVEAQVQPAAEQVPDAPTTADSANRSFFGTMFDFLFGWMV